MAEKISALNGIYRYDPDSKAAPRIITLRPDLTCDLHAVDPASGEQRLLTIGTYVINWGPTIELTWTQRPSINVPTSENYALIDDARTLTRMGGGYLRYKGPADPAITGPAAPLAPRVPSPQAVRSAAEVEAPPQTTAVQPSTSGPETPPPEAAPGVDWGKWIAAGAAVGGALALKGLKALAKEIERASAQKNAGDADSPQGSSAPLPDDGQLDPRVVGAFSRGDFYSSGSFSASTSVTRVFLPDGRFFITSAASADYTHLHSGAGVSASTAAERGYQSAGRDSRGRWTTRGKVLYLAYDDGDTGEVEYGIDGGSLVLWVDGAPQVWER
ncbi:MAG: hypothetical protein HND48_18485 [Chloroflexi bacterium]|nr:hypothetical protein [Chloroflexota bacterium]